MHNLAKVMDSDQTIYSVQTDRSNIKDIEGSSTQSDLWLTLYAINTTANIITVYVLK